MQIHDIIREKERKKNNIQEVNDPKVKVGDVQVRDCIIFEIKQRISRVNYFKFDRKPFSCSKGSDEELLESDSPHDLSNH